MRDRLNRRTFLFGALAAPVMGRSVARAAGAPGRLRLGFIGVAGRGADNLDALADQEVVALCDVDLGRAGAAKARFPQAEVVQDFRRVIDRNDLHGVVISTPDHWHAIPAVWAMETGKHVYCEKPLGRAIGEARVMADAAKRYRRVTQLGTQIHAGANYRRVVELVQAGAIGPVRRVDVWCSKQPTPGRRVPDGTPPATLDYELWTGPAPQLPFNRGVIPHGWRWWWEYGGGVLADMGCHYIDLPHWALGLRHPERVTAGGTLFAEADNKVPVELRADFYYPARDPQPPVQLVWWHGIPGPRDDTGQLRSLGFSSGVLFQGESGQLLADYNRHRLLPAERFKDYARPTPSIPDSAGHHKEWVQAILAGGTPTCNFDYGGALTETVLLGNVAFRLGREIQWDPARLAITNVRRQEWESLLWPQYRGDWKLQRRAG